MSVYQYEQAFGQADKTTSAMRSAIEEWFSLYYGAGAENTDPCQRIAYTVVSKVVRTVFGEYQSKPQSNGALSLIRTLEERKEEAVQLALVGGECYIKPCPELMGFSFRLVPRNNILVFARDAQGRPTDIGLVEKTTEGKYYYTLLERRRVDEKGYLTIINRLYRSLNSQSLGTQVTLVEHPAYEELPEQYRYAEPIGSVGLVRMKTPMLNCVDGSPDGVAIFGAATGLIGNLDANEAQLNGEFSRGQSRILASADLLRADGSGSRTLQDSLFVGLDEDPERVGLTIFSPTLREQSYIARKQEYLRNIESLIGLQRGMLSDANMEERTATEITASAGQFNLTVIEFQRMWEKALRETVALCRVLARLYRLPQIPEGTVSVDWGNGVLYDEDKTWEAYRNMVADGILKPEIALGWRFNMPVDSEGALLNIRRALMPAEASE